MSSFQIFKRFVYIYFLREVMTELVHEGHLHVKLILPISPPKALSTFVLTHTWMCRTLFPYQVMVFPTGFSTWQGFNEATGELFKHPTQSIDALHFFSDQEVFSHTGFLLLVNLEDNLTLHPKTLDLASGGV